MLKVRVQSEQVRRNLDLFRKITAESRKESDTTLRASYTAWVNKETGAIEYGSSVGHDSSTWKSIRLELDLRAHEALVFDGGKKEFESADLLPHAFHIVQETLRILKGLTTQVDDLREFSHLDVTTALMSEPNRDMIHEAWHQVDRIGAEKLLLHHHTEGNYLFRKDPIAQQLEGQLCDEWKMPVKCLTLTYLDPEERVRDLTVVFKDNLWMFYDDNPNLIGRSYSSIEELLATMDTVLSKPLLHEAVSH